jgi:hypothetical protein
MPISSTSLRFGHAATFSLRFASRFTVSSYYTIVIFVKKGKQILYGKVFVGIKLA